MSLTRVIDPVDAVVSQAEIKAHCRVLHSDDDSVLTGLVAAATSHLDGYQGVLGFCLALQTWELTYDAFPCGIIRLPLGPVTSVVSVKYLNATGIEVTLLPPAYEVDLTGGDGWIGAVSSWPETGDYLNAVRVRFVCGSASIPDWAKVAVKMLAGHWYENRAGEGQMPPAVEALISSHRRMSI